MLQGAKINLISKLNELFDFAKKGKEDFVNILCNFLVAEYDFNATVLLKVSNKKLSVLGRSENSKKNFTIGTEFSCEVCHLLKENSNGFYSSADCSLQISDFVIDRF